MNIIVTVSADVNGYLAKLVTGRHTPGISYAFFSSDQIIKSFHFGLADVLKQKPVEESTSFNAYSVTKTFTALGILQLAEKGRLRLDDPATQLLASFPYPEPITVRHLLTHTSGIPNPIPLKWIHLKEEHRRFDRDQFFRRIFHQHSRLKSAPGATFSYSNLNYVLLGQIIESVTGMEYEEFIRAGILNLIDPGATELRFNIDELRQAKGYHKRLSISGALLGFLVDRLKYMDEAEGGWMPFKFILVNGTAYGGLIATAAALTSYGQELLDDRCRFISQESKRLLFTENKTSGGKRTGMCLSWFRGELNGREYFCHAGGGGGYYCEVRLYPSINRGSVVMLNRSGLTDERLLSSIDRFVIR